MTVDLTKCPGRVGSGFCDRKFEPTSNAWTCFVLQCPMQDCKDNSQPLPEEPPPGVFTHKMWQELLQSSIATIEELSTLKGGEYAGDFDRLANFRRNGQALGLPMEVIWAVYAGKHFDAIQQYVKDLAGGKTRPRAEPLSGRVDDLIIYCLLLKAMLLERGEA